MPHKMSWRERVPGHGNIFTPHAGSMMIHVHRESGLAHRTVTLKAWQVRALRLVMSKWFFVALGAATLSWSYLALQAARVPMLKERVAYLQLDARRLDTLQHALVQLQARYDQVRKMLTAAPEGEKGAVGNPRSIGSVPSTAKQP
ncbi:MAG TPA: hypothetical protein VHE78_11775 [Gemmatimonadaceae bacterium]|nr:hypothetical protein [Gemmatimonadaceae bacterium]